MSLMATLQLYIDENEDKIDVVTSSRNTLIMHEPGEKDVIFTVTKFNNASNPFIGGWVGRKTNIDKRHR